MAKFLLDFYILTFGPLSARYIFTKLLCPLVRYLHSWNLRIIEYLGDGLCGGERESKALGASVVVCSTLCQASIVMNAKNSSLEANPALTVTGVCYNHVQRAYKNPSGKDESC